MNLVVWSFYKEKRDESNPDLVLGQKFDRFLYLRISTIDTSNAGQLIKIDLRHL